MDKEIKNKKKNFKHSLVKAYLNEFSIVESNVLSFNDFIDVKMQDVVNMINDDVKRENGEIELGKIMIGKPNIIEADGSKREIFPIEARLRKLTYSAPLFLEIFLKKENSKEPYIVEIGRIQVMVKSKVCNLNGKPKEELLEQYYEDPADTGGYFIINGNERILMMIEDLAPNHPFLEKGSRGLSLRVFSQKGTYTIPISIVEAKNGIINLTFSRFKDIPVILMVKALGMLKDSEIAKSIGEEYDGLIVNLYEFASVQSVDRSLMKIAEIMGLDGTKKEVTDRVKQRIDSFFLPHIGMDKKDRIEKALTLCKLVRQLFIAKKDNSVLSDKDHYANKRVRLSGDLLMDLFRVNLTIFVRDIQNSLQKLERKSKFYSLKTIAKGTLFAHRIESAIATGSWIGEKTGITQNMDKTNSLSVFSQLLRVVSLLPSEQENFKARTLHPTHFGRFCPIETPEGTPIGLRKNLALLAKVSTPINFSEDELTKILKDAGLKKDAEKDIIDVFYNGKFFGSVDNGKEFSERLREKRRHQELPQQIGISFDEKRKLVSISGEVGRVLRPLIVAKEGKSLLTEENMQKVEEGILKWSDLEKGGMIEYLDAGEEENALTALNEEDLTDKHTHLEIDSVAMFGLITSLVPFGNHDHSSRLMRGSKTQKQGLGIYNANFHARIDTDVSIIHYPQRPIVKSAIYDMIDFYPVGQNVVVAVMPYEGYNIEDAVVLNKASIERGLGRSTYFRPYTTIELNYAGGLKDEIEIPTKDVSGYRTEENYRFLEKDGVVYPEANLKENDVVIGKTSPPKFLSDMGGMSIAKSRKENSLAIRQEEEGVVDFVCVTTDDQRNKIIQVKMRDQRIPELGDKFATTHGQKGIVGMIVPEEDVPFTASGVRPDIIFNPHGIPSRMTVGYLIELIAGKIAAVSGNVIDGTSFEHQKIEDFEKTLLELGFRPDGKETLYNGITGEMMKAKIYVGNMYYLRLKYMVANKLHARSYGKITLLTRQPVEGRAKGGALRLGEMEKDALIGHGASLLLKERFSSDNVVVHICEKCGSMGVKDILRKRNICPLCGEGKLEPIQISYASKLLLEELMALHIFPKIYLKSKYL